MNQVSAGARITTRRTVTAAPLQPVEVLGIDETRRGRTQWRQNPGLRPLEAGRRPVAHRIRRRLRGQGPARTGGGPRTPADVLAWLSTTPLPWRKRIRFVAIDMSTTCRAAIRTGLPHATVVVDHFHVVQLANKMLNIVRRRTTATLRGRRGRATDPEWKARRPRLP